jgi:hypothetical protein
LNGPRGEAGTADHDRGNCDEQDESGDDGSIDPIHRRTPGEPVINRARSARSGDRR